MAVADRGHAGLDLTGFKEEPPTFTSRDLDPAVRGDGGARPVRPEARDEPRRVAGGLRAAEHVAVRDEHARRATISCGSGARCIEARCVGCHGPKGDGNGPAATFLFPRPRDFTVGVFKFRTTPSGSLPTDGDLFRTVTRGVRWTAMPTWHELPDKERLAVVTFIKTFSKRWKDEKPEPALVIGEPPKATPELVARGKELYGKAKCFQCHGDGGKGDGVSAAELKDDFGFPIRPADFTRGQFKGGSGVRDIFRTMTLGLDGAPMPSFADSMSEEERWAISYYVLSLSAWIDPHTGKRLVLPAGRAGVAELRRRRR